MELGRALLGLPADTLPAKMHLAKRGVAHTVKHIAAVTQDVEKVSVPGDIPMWTDILQALAQKKQMLED